ncbi:ninein isoform X5 [Labrus bergylta]|uniref:ninein isoform X5 n=1 Tax=Labrus bergylta TaxID=56723 RepID=UPI003313943C
MDHFVKGRLLSCGMDDAQEQDHYEERLKELFNSFDGSSCGSLCLEELSDLCESLHLEEAAAALMQTLLQDQDRRAARVDFEQFKEALILVLSSSTEPVPAETETFPRAESPEIQPKFVKGSKRYGRRTTPEFIEPFSGTPEVRNAYSVEEEDPENVPRKRERWIAQETSPEEYEAEGQMHLWNPDELSTPRGAGVPLSSCLEDRLREACSELEIAWDGCADHNDLLALCEHLGLEIHVDILQNLTADGLMNVHQFVSMVTNQNKPPTPSASTPYRQLKRHHSTQPFDEGGRRIATPSALSSTIGMRLFSTLDDGSGFTAVEEVLDAWMEEGIENSAEILQALNFSLNEKLSLSDLTMALENELLVTKNGIHQAALASFKAEIRYLLEQVDRELREKEKIRSDLEKAEKQKTQLATEVDEHHSAIEHMNNLNLRKLEQEHREKLAAVRSELTKEMDLMQQQAGLQREELEAEVEKIKEDECFLRDHLSISVKENRRLEMELLDSTDKLEEAQIQISKLQSSLDNIIKERFGDLDLGSADLFLQEERIKQLRSSYEAQCRELQDRIDELQSELQEFHGLGRVLQPGQKSLCEELETKSPGMESDPGIGSEDVQTFSMSLEAEMMLEQLKEQHLQEMEDLRKQLERKINEFDQMVEKQRATHDEQKAALALQHQQEVQALREETDRFQVQTQELQSRLQEAHQERTQAEERKELEDLQEVKRLRQQLLETHTHSAHLEERLKTLEDQQEQSMEELRRQHAEEIRRLEEEHVEICEDRLREERQKVQGEKAELEKRLLEDYQTEKKLLQQSQEEELKIRGEEVKRRCEEKCEEVVQSLTEKWHREKAQLDEHNNEALQLLLEEEMLRLVREQEEKEATLREQLEERHEEALLRERGRVQVREEQLEEEREQLEREKEKEEKRLQVLISEERALLEERHQEAVKELTANHSEEREALSSTLDKLREDIVHERSETSRLAEENFVLRKKITTLKEEDLKEAQGELIQKLEHLKKGKMSAQRVAENLKKQISELRLQSQQLEDENGMLSEKNAQNIVDMETLRQQLAELIKDEDQNKLTACVSALEAELTAALEDAAKLEERNVQLSEQLSELREKNHVLEMSLHSSSLQNTKLYREEVCGLMEQDQLLLRRENERLQVEVHDIRGDLLQSREKIHQLDATISSLKQNRQQSQSSALQTALEQENATLRRELEAQRELNKGCEASRGHADVESLQQENEALRAQMTRMSSQLMESFQAQLVGLLPPSPHRIPRGQHRAEDPDNQQDERETKMKNMEERMREVELSLRNVKLLLREKVFQLRDQLHKNGKADVLITDLYMENAQLLKALEKTEKRQKISEKKNYLLEEKICSLNRIVRDLNPAPSLPYHF